MALNTPNSQVITAALNTVATVTLTAYATDITIWNRTGTGEVWISVDGSTPTVAGANLWFLPAQVTSIVIPIIENPGAELNTFPIVKAISGAALSLWLVVNP